MLSRETARTGSTISFLTHKLQCKDESWRTYAAFAHAHRLCAPFIVNGTFELQEPRMRQISQPPIGRMFYCDLSKFIQQDLTNGRAKTQILTLIEFAEQSASNDVRRCCTSELQTASRDWSGTMRSDTCAVTDAGMTVGSLHSHYK